MNVRHHFFTFGFGCLAACLVSCAQDTKIKPYENSALAESDRMRFVEVLKSATRTSLAVELAGVDQNNITASKIQTAAAEDSTTKMAERLKTSGCTTNYAHDENPHKPATDVEFVFDTAEASGSTCPVSMKISNEKKSGTEEHEIVQGLDVSSGLSYLVTEEEFKKLNDVVGINLTGNFKSNWENTKAPGKRIIRWNGKMQLSGVVQSQKHGTIKYRQRINYIGQGQDSVESWRSNLEVTIEMDFQDTDMRLELVRQENGAKASKPVMRLNGETIEDEELHQILLRMMPVRATATSDK